MRLSLSHKLTLSILGLCVLCTALVWLSTRLLFQSYFVDYINQQEQLRMAEPTERLTVYYEQFQDWRGLREHPELWRQLAFGEQLLELDSRSLPMGTRPPPQFQSQGQNRNLPNVGPDQGAALVTVSGEFIAGDRALTVSQELIRMPVFYRDREVAYLIGRKQVRLTGIIDQNFAKSLNQSTLWALVAIVALSLVVAAILARNLSTPIRRLSRGTNKLTQGNYNERISMERSDEIGQLAEDFNTLAKTLDSNKHNQQRWIADISHELRTPLAVLKGELMAIEDGIRDFDQSSLLSLANETDRLGRMVNDLYDLSRADTDDLDYRMEPLNLIDILQEAVSKNRKRFADKNIQLGIETNKTEILMTADNGRMTQVFTNLLENSHRYTNADGKTTITCKVGAGVAQILVEDTEPGIPDIDCEKIFERLYRVESSRSRRYGGGGLGLTLCKTIIEAHQGSISAEKSALGGLKISVRLPLNTI